MKATLIKRVNKFEGVHYILKDEKDWITASTLTKEPGLALSIKNCQAIERGYDLDELAKESSKEYFIKPIEAPIFTFGYEEGFQKALELMGDKKFSEQDMYKMFDYARSIDTAKKHIKKLEDKPIDEFFNDFIQSLQQTEWDVEIVMGGYRLNDDGEKIGFPSYELPKLDTDGCLILKRI